jgi:uncharacterized protein YciI
MLSPAAVHGLYSAVRGAASSSSFVRRLSSAAVRAAARSARGTRGAAGVAGPRGAASPSSPHSWLALEYVYEAATGAELAAAPLRAAHLAHAASAPALVLGGALGGGSRPGGLLIFASSNAEIAERFAANDPYVKGGIVRSWSVRPWTVVVDALS